MTETKIELTDVTAENAKEFYAQRFNESTETVTGFLAQAKDQMVKGTEYYAGTLAMGLIQTTKELMIFKELEFHIVNKSLSEEVFADIMKRLGEHRAEVKALNAPADQPTVSAVV